LLQEYTPVVRGFLRILLYAGITSLIFLIVYIDAVILQTFGETSYVEIAQAVLLGGISIIFIAAALKIPALQTSAWLLATFSTASLIRENDIWLDMLHPEGWQILVTPVLAAGLFHAWRNRSAFLAEQRIYTESTSFGLLAAALMTTYLFARLYGMGAFWRNVMPNGYDRNVKDMSEECMELFGYGILLCAALEFVALAKRVAQEQKAAGTVEKTA